MEEQLYILLQEYFQIPGNQTGETAWGTLLISFLKKKEKEKSPNFTPN